MKTNNKSPLASMRDVSVTFGFFEALKHIDVDFYPGEILGVVGDNGAGKSTLLKVLAGVYEPDIHGSLIFKNQPVSLGTIRESRELGIAAVFQDTEFCDNLDVTANLFLGREIRDLFRRLDISKMERRARKVLAEVSSPIGLRKPISTLSKGQSQMLSIARTLLDDPVMILLDEPTASLSVTQTAEVLTYIKELRSKGKSIVFICNTLPDIFAVADRILVLRHGHVKGIHQTSETSYEQVIAEIAGVDNATGLTNTQSFTENSRFDNQRRLIDRTDSSDDEHDIQDDF